MGKPNQIREKMPRLMRMNYLDIALFNWVLAFKRMFPNEKEETVLKLFMKEYELSEDEYSMESAHVQINRMFKWYYEMKREPDCS